MASYRPDRYLSDADVIAIRADARPQRLIAADYHLSQGLVSAIKRRAIYADVAPEQEIKYPKSRAKPRQRLTNEQVLAIRADKRTFKEIAADFNTTHQNVSSIKSFKTFKDL